jgi:hypothetical protein
VGGAKCRRLGVEAHQSVRDRDGGRKRRGFFTSAPHHREVDRRTECVADERSVRPWRVFPAIVCNVWPPIEQSRDVGLDALGWRTCVTSF